MREPIGCYSLDVTIHSSDCKDKQSKYFVHGYDDVYWLDTVEQVLSVLRRELERDTELSQKTECL